MQVRWSPEAAEDFERIVKRILQENPAAARRVADVLYDGISTLEQFPKRGRVGRLEGSRELVFPPLPYVVVYRLKDEFAEIVRIYHAAQDWK